MAVAQVAYRLTANVQITVPQALGEAPDIPDVRVDGYARQVEAAHDIVGFVAGAYVDSVVVGRTDGVVGACDWSRSTGW